MFWNLIGRLGPDLCPGRLTIAHGALDRHQALAFGWQLERAAAGLDSLAHRRHARQAREHRMPDRDLEPGPVASLPTGTPSFRELQLTVVALGQDAWAAVVAVPTLLAASWPLELGRHLLDLAEPPLVRSGLARGA
ncbi:hypothetical protein [Microlunatus flavus]|uniref:Uncharacterized protein n=1 Tax=Microlunatus flavus TaxID=1036181 RepID=A0A1H9G0B1_9ACTN|nr:hypothetical protein [Microlunatus flavus]SEQ43353.1 hypothetical protein SAMN05421756_103445 [Microlunatus flavus]